MTKEWDVLVIGAGPAGIAAAVSAAEAGKRVCIVDDNPRPGGQIWRGSAKDARATAWKHRLEAASADRLFGWHVFARPAPYVLRAEKAGECVDLRYHKLIVATGAREIFLPFRGWTLPNVMGAGALQSMVKSGLPIAGKRVAVAGSGPLLLAVAAYLKQHGAQIVALCEQAPLARLVRFASALLGEGDKLRQAFGLAWQMRGIPFHSSTWPVAANGSDRVESVVLRNANREWTINCDYLACGFHLIPNTEFAELLGCLISEGRVVVDEIQQTSVPDVFCAGEPTGLGGLEAALLEGQIAGYCSAGAPEKAKRLLPQRKSMQRFASRLAKTFRLDPQLRKLAAPETVVCRCEDVPFDTLQPFRNWRAAKLHTRCGMGPCQGRVCGPATQFLFGWTPSSVRAPIFPASVGSLCAPVTQAPLLNKDRKENG
jgi:NADPH-dependent 2,4-dienoyl-CoA reductase/sulfur reductase-like enzyme